MSREELAESVALWACDHDDKRRGVAFDANHLGKLERGTVRCPRQLYVDALCAVLHATPAELGFDSAAENARPLLAVPDPAGVLDPDERERLSLAAGQPCRTDGAAIEALAAVLFGVRQLEDETSAAAVFPIVHQQRTLADRLVAGAPAQARSAAVGLSSEINQYLGWLSIPLGRWDDAHRYLDHAAVLALEADDPLRLSTALSFHAYARLRTGDLRKADSLSEAAQRDTRVHSGLRTYLTYQRAEVLARDNERTDAVRLLTKADRMVGSLPSPEELPPSGYWYVPAFFLGQRGFVLHALGDTNGARRSALECLATMPEAWRDSEWAIRRRKLAEE
ncbi:MAG: XRE family transcriptional regulator [Pseudonocardiaceae bacterium]